MELLYDNTLQINICCRCVFAMFIFGTYVYYYVQESSKTNHPQLLYEAKLYNALQGGSMRLSTYKSYFADCYTIICVELLLF
jgi:hypothetical protein